MQARKVARRPLEFGRAVQTKLSRASPNTDDSFYHRLNKLWRLGKIGNNLHDVGHYQYLQCQNFQWRGKFFSFLFQKSSIYMSWKMTPSWNTREVPSPFFNHIFYVSVMMMMMMFNAQCTKHSCTCPIFFVHPPDQSTFTTGPPHPAWKTLCPYGVGKIYVLKGTNMFLDSFQRNTIQFRGNSYLFRNFSWQAPIFRSLSPRVATLFPKIILFN